MNGNVEYKVISQRDTKILGSFDLQGLETALNTHAAEGWHLVEGLVASSIWKSGKTEIVLMLERPARADLDAPHNEAPTMGDDPV